MNKAFVILLFLINFSCSGNPQEQNKIVPSGEYMHIIKKSCPDPDIVEVEKSQDGYIEVEYLCDGRLFEVAISNNSIVYLEFLPQRRPSHCF